MFGDVQRLIERCIRREQRAWDEFIERFSGLLYYSAQKRLNRSGIAYGHQDIEDIVQIVFVELWEKGKLEEVRDRKKIGSWLSIVTQTRALNFMRSKKERLLHTKELYKIDNISQDINSSIDEELVGKLEEIIEGFGDKEKIIFKLNIIYGKTHRQIAEFMKMPTNTISTIIARKKNMVREKLKE